MTWLDVEGGYALTVDLTDLAKPTIRARNAKGRELATVPPKVRKSDAFTQLDAVLDRLAAHRRDVRTQVNQWMLDSLPVPVAQFAAVWPDPFWAEALTDLVVSADGATGLLREVSDGQLGLVTLDGASAGVRAGPRACGDRQSRPRTGAHGLGRH